MRNPIDWQLAQKNELDLWKKTSKSAWRILSELSETSDLQNFIEFKLGDIEVDGKKILEIGIGPLGIGWVGLFGSNNKEYNIAIEPLPVLSADSGLPCLDEFVKRLQDRVNMRTGNGEHLEFTSESFDIVVCNDVIDHVGDYNLLLQEAFRVLKRGGLYIFSVNVFSVFGAMKWNQYTKRRFSDDVNVLCHPHCFTYSAVHDILKKHGFTILHSNDSIFSIWKRIFGKSKKARFLCAKL